MELTIPNYGKAIAKLDEAVSFGVNHNLVYDTAGDSYTRGIRSQIERLRQAARVSVMIAELYRINGVDYRLRATVQRANGGWHVSWSGNKIGSFAGPLTDKARERLNDDADARTDIGRWVEANIDALRRQAIEDYVAEVQDKLRTIRENVTTIETAIAAEVA